MTGYVTSTDLFRLSLGRDRCGSVPLTSPPTGYDSCSVTPRRNRREGNGPVKSGLRAEAT